MSLKYIEDLDLSRICIKDLAKQNKNNSVMWTTKIYESPESSKSPIGQMSSFMRVIYVITPGKDKTAQTHPDGNRNCDVIVEAVDQKFIDQMNILNDFALKHAIKNKDYYWEGEELSDKQVMKKHRKLIVPTKEGDKMVFRSKLRAPVRKNRKGELVKNPRGTVMIRVDENDDEAEEPTSIDEVHCKGESRDFVQNILDFVCFYRTDAYFGINVYVPQGWHKTEEFASYTRNKRKSTHVSGGADQPGTTRAREEEEASAPAPAPAPTHEEDDDDIEDDYGDDYE
jgi:hypothetical protein